MPATSSSGSEQILGKFSEASTPPVILRALSIGGASKGGAGRTGVVFMVEVAAQDDSIRFDVGSCLSVTCDV